MEIKEVIEAWWNEELSGDAAMAVISSIIFPATITQEDIDWAKASQDKNAKVDIGAGELVSIGKGRK